MEEEIIPHEWKCGVICPVRKKGDIMICGNIQQWNCYVLHIKFRQMFYI